MLKVSLDIMKEIDTTNYNGEPRKEWSTVKSINVELEEQKAGEIFKEVSRILSEQE